MSGDLRERLADLAGEAPTRGAAYDDLWRRGRRRVVRERIGAGLAVLVALAGLGSVLGLTLGHHDPEPVAPDGRAGLPDRFFTPGPWLAGTADHPIGPLAAVFGATRDTWSGWRMSSGQGYLAVSAATGAYRFLDLPGAALDEDVAMGQSVQLSPDGRWVGYWLGGTVTDSDGARVGAVTGYALYDTVTGRVRRHLVPSSMGLQTVGTTWTRGRAWFQWQPVTERRDGFMAMGDRVTVSVSVRTDTAEPVTGRVDDLSVTSSDGRRAVVTRDRRIQILSGPDDAPGLRRRLSDQVDTAYVSPGGDRVAAFPARARCCPERDILVGRVGSSPLVDLTAVPGERGIAVLGWRDDRSVLVLRASGRVESVDVATGAVSALSVLPVELRSYQLSSLASDVWAGPVVSGTRPPDSHDPRVRLLLLGLAGVGGAGALAAVGRWTRRRRGRA